MKKIVIIIVVIALLVAGYIFILKKLSKLMTLPQTTKEQKTPIPQITSQPEITSFDTNDNLDQAILDLSQVE